MKYVAKQVLERAVVETLEGRQLFSSVMLTTAGVLTLQGDATSGNSLLVSVDSRGMVVASANGAAGQTYSPSAVKQVRMIGGAAGDKLVAAGVSVPVYVDGGAGDDTIAGGAGADTLLGGAGNDSVDAGGGSDLVRGGDGNDSLVGGNGDDSLFGEAGDNTLVGGAGTNVLDGGDGTDTLDGVTGVPTTAGTVNPAAVKLTGTGFGTAGSWNNTGNTFEKALDGNAGSYYDSSVGDGAVVGLDLGSARVVTSVRFYPRGGLAWRMVGGTFQGSNDNATWTTLGTLTAEPQQGVYSTLGFANTAAYRYVRYVSPAGGWGNVSELEFYGTAPVVTAPAGPGGLAATDGGASGVTLRWADNSTNETGFKVERSTDGGTTFTLVGTVGANVVTYTDTSVAAGTTYTYRVRATNAAGDSAASGMVTVTTAVAAVPVKLTGTGFGTAGSWNDTGNTFDKALDGNGATYFDSSVGDGAVVGLDLGSAKVITGVRFMPRSYWSERMVGGRFEGSNDNAAWTTLATVTVAPAQGQYTTLAVAGGGAYRYVRYVSPAGGWGNVAEMEFYGTDAPPGGGNSGSANGSSSGNTGTTVDVPSAPTGVTAAVTSAGAVSVAWTASASAAGVGGYRIERSTAGGAWGVLASVDAGGTTYTDESAAAGTTYSYRVVATGAAGDSAASGVATVTTPSAVVAGAPRAVVSLMEGTITAGMSVQANGLLSVLSSGSPVSTRYEWDFGDPSGAYNKLSGFNAAHVYAAVGTYTVTLTVTDDQGRSATGTATVTVTADNRKTVYVDSVNGNDANGGLSASAPVRTAARAFQMAGNDTKILFNRGGTYAVTGSLSVGYKNFTVGAYGTGAKPVLSWAGGSEYWWEIISGTGNSRDVMVRDMVIDGGATHVNGVAPRGVNFDVVNCEFRNLFTAINCAGNPAGVLVQDNTQAAGANVTDYWLWLQGTDAVVVGNNIGPGGMYAIRTSGGAGETVTRALFAYNTLANADRSNLRVQKGAYAYITDNTFTTSGVEFGPLGGGDGKNDPNWATAHTSYVVFENNRVTLAADKYVRLTTGLEHVVVRNNVIQHDHAGSAIGIEGYDGSYGRIVADAVIANNTIIDNATVGIGIEVEAPENGPQISILNNVFVAPNLVGAASTGSANVWVNDSTMASLRAVSGNVWSAPLTEGYVGPLGYVYVKGVGETGFITPAMWEAYTNVQGDLFQNVTLGSVYQVTLNGVTAGANLARA